MDPAIGQRQSTQTSPTTKTTGDAATIARIKTLLEAKDDTQCFVGLALLKSVLDNTPDLRQDEQVIQDLWASVSPRFLDRLIKTGSKASSKDAQDAKEMLDLAVSVLHIFAALVPEGLRAQDKFTGRIPWLVNAVLYSSGETTAVLLKLLHTLVCTPDGAKSFVEVNDVSPLAEIAPAHAIVLDIFSFAWLNGMASVVEKHVLAIQVAETLRLLVAAFTGTDGVTLLEFLASFLRQADPAILPHRPQWLKTVIGFIQNLAASRPNLAARSAYTNAAASILQAYPAQASTLLFTENTKDDEPPLAYLLISLLLIDIRSSIPSLLQQLNQPGYAKLSLRLASAYDVISLFIGYLVRCLEDDCVQTFTISPDGLLKLRKGISETMSLTIEYLRDRWDATFAGAMGLHPDARSSKTETSTGSHRTLAWDSLSNSADEDPLILSAVRALALWLREDANETLRKEAMGLTDMFMELYQSSSAGKLDFRSAALVGLEALITTQQGRQLFLRNDGWRVLSKDLASLLSPSADNGSTDAHASRGIEVVRVLLSVAEEETSGSSEEWMDLVTTVAAWGVSTKPRSPTVAEFQVSVLQLCCTLLVGATPGMRRRYRQSTSAINGIVRQMSCSLSEHEFLKEALNDVRITMQGLEESQD